MIRGARALVLPAALVLLVMWAMLSSAGSGVVRAATPGSATAGQLAIALVFLGTFAALAANLGDRVVIVATGAFAAIFVGIAFGAYAPDAAARYLGGKLDALILLTSVGLVTGLVEESGLFGVVARHIVRASRANARSVFVRLCVLTYVLSLFMNNLVTILVLIPISLRVADELEMDGVTLVLGEIIASNLGGASTMVGDFPNILLATEVGLPFHEFLLYLAPVCVLQLGLLLTYLGPRFPDRNIPPRRVAELDRRLGGGTLNRRMAVRGGVVLGTMVLGFLVGGFVGVPPALVAVLAASKVLAFGGLPARRIVRHLHLRDALFFAALFTIVGAVAATGLLDEFGVAVGRLWSRSPLGGALAVAWGAALLTSVLNAGPTTAVLIHSLALGMGDATANHVVWWALSLGVCAGSSATLTGATAGPIAAGLLERHGKTLSFGRFARTGIPMMLAFLVVTTSYLVLLLSR